jgi:hypothetical protein
MRRLLSVLAFTVLAGCATNKTDMDKLQETLLGYSATIRWGEWSRAQSFIDEDYAKKHPISELELERFKQIQVSFYHDGEPVPTKEGEVKVRVEIGLVNINTQSARNVVETQTWRYDVEKKRWWLMTGLPDITHH